MARILVVWFFYGCLLTIVSAEEVSTITQLLVNDDWMARSEALSLIRRNFDQYQHNDVVKQAVLRALIEENNRHKNSRNNHVETNGVIQAHEVLESDEGRGEYYLSILKLVIKFDIPNSIEALLDSAGHGGPIENFIADKLLKEGENEVTILQSIQEKINSADIFYRGMRSSYFSIIRKYLEKHPFMSQSKEALVREIVFNGMLLYDEFAQIDAIACSEYFPDLITKALPELIRRATTETDTEVRRSNVRALGELGDPSAIPILKDLLHDPESRIRDMAAYALTQFQDASIVPLLIQALDNPDAHVRLRTAWHLGDIRATEAIPALKKLATDDPYIEEVDEQRAKKYGVYEQRDGRYFVYRVRYAAQEALKLIEGIEPTPRPTPTELSATPVNTPVPAPQPTETPSPAPTETPHIHYRRSLTPLPTAPGPGTTPQEQFEQHTSSELSSSIQQRIVIIGVVVLVLGVIGYVVYRMRGPKK